MSDDGLSIEDGRFLVKLARKAVREYLNRGVETSVEKSVPSNLREKRGVFVTINKLVYRGDSRHKQLRGCIGFPYPTLPLVDAVVDAAISAASSDPRFKPLSIPELSDVVFEVSVLTLPEVISASSPRDYPKLIRLGLDGLIVERGFFRGLLLPQVAVEWGWTSEEFLSNCCMKAGLPPDAWLDPDVKVYRFQAEIFEELEPDGEVIKKELHWS